MNVTTRAPGRRHAARSAMADRVSSAKQVEFANTTSPSVQSNSGERKEPFPLPRGTATKAYLYNVVEGWQVCAGGAGTGGI